MSILNQEMQKEIHKNPEKYGYNVPQFMFKTGFDTFDYLNGQVSYKDDGSKEYQVGIDAGKIVTIIGKSGSGKSTFGIQMGTNIIRRYEEGQMYVLDYEQSNTEQRIKMITGMSDEEFNEKVTITKVGISTESVLEYASKIKEIKKAHEKELMVENKEGVLDSDGKPLMILPPTVIFVDSIAMMMPREILTEEEFKGQMNATAMAKANTQLFKKLVQIGQEGNIIFIFINHINQKINAGPMPTQAQVNYLKQDETLPGGNAPIFLSNTLIKITTSSKLEDDKAYKIKGFEAKVELIKSRSAEAGRSTVMIFNQIEGFDNELSLLEFIKANGKLKGNGMAYYLDGYDQTKFRASNFKEKLEEDSDFRNYFYALGKMLLEDSMKVSSKIEKPISEDKEEVSEELETTIYNEENDQ